VSLQHLEIRELTAWGFDDPIDRGSLTPEQLQSAAIYGQRRLAECEPYWTESPISAELPNRVANLLATRKKAVADSGEFDGLIWKLAVVDLQKLIAFQRRVGFTDEDSFRIEHKVAWRQLLDLALPINAPSRSPYIEVASYGGRWFLRDGYHRSFRLLKKGMSLVPAVVVYAETLAQMGAIGSQFFAEEVLFSRRPPMVTDFLDDAIALRYLRPLGEKVAGALDEPVQIGCYNREE